MKSISIKYWDTIKNNVLYIILFFLTTFIISYSVIKKSIYETKNNAKDIIKLIKVLNDSTELGRSVLVYKQNQLDEDAKEIYPNINFFVMNSFDSIKTIPNTKYYKAYVDDKISFLDEKFNRLTNDNYKLIKENHSYFTIEVNGEVLYLNHDLLRVKPLDIDDNSIREYLVNQKRVFISKLNGLWGMKDEKNNIILPFIYQEMNVVDVRDYQDEVVNANNSIPHEKVKENSRLRLDVLYYDNIPKQSISNRAVFKRNGEYGIVDLTTQLEIFGPFKCNAMLITNNHKVNEDIVLINTGVLNKKHKNVSIDGSIYEVENTKWSYYSISKKRKLFAREFKTATFFDENNRALVNRSENTVELIDNTGKSFGLIDILYDGK